MAIAISAAALLLFLHRGDAEGAARLANRAVDDLLQSGEAVEHRVPVQQRHWWTWFRVSHGVLAATDRRILYIGVPPAGILPREEEPVELEEGSWRYDQPVAARREPTRLGNRVGLVLRLEGVDETFAVAGQDVAKVDTLFAIIVRRRAELAAVREAERRALEFAAEAARRPIHHEVLAGESLERIAARYGATLDSLRVWNKLRGDRIFPGQRLLVKPGQ